MPNKEKQSKKEKEIDQLAYTLDAMGGDGYGKGRGRFAFKVAWHKMTAVRSCMFCHRSGSLPQ